MNTFASVAAYFRSLSYGKRISILSALVLVIMLPAILLVVSQQENINSKADTTTIIEGESGTLSGNAVVKSSDMASGGKYVLLNASTTIQPPTPTAYIAPTATPTPRPRPTITPTPTPTPRPGNRNDQRH